MQVSLPDMCSVLLTLHAAHAAIPRGHAPGSGPQAVVLQTFASVCATVVADVQRRFRDDSDATSFHPWEYAVLFQAVGAGDSPDREFLEEAAELAADDMEWLPAAWRMRDAAPVLVAAATHDVRVHRLFSAAGLLCVERMREMGGRGSAAAAARELESLEGVVWAFAVSRRVYPYSADSVCAAAQRLLHEVLEHAPEAVEVGAMAELLWSFAAMWRTPRELFAAADVALAVREEQDVSVEAARSLEWSFGRAGMVVPAVVRMVLPNETVS
jgi:hypothetical protein